MSKIERLEEVVQRLEKVTAVLEERSKTYVTKEECGVKMEKQCHTLKARMDSGFKDADTNRQIIDGRVREVQISVAKIIAIGGTSGFVSGVIVAAIRYLLTGGL